MRVVRSTKSKGEASISKARSYKSIFRFQKQLILPSTPLDRNSGRFGFSFTRRSATADTQTTVRQLTFPRKDGFTEVYRLWLT